MTAMSPADVLERYHVGLDTGDYALAVGTMADDVVLHSPITGRVPIRGKDAVGRLTRIVLATLDGMHSTAYPIDTRLGLVRFTASVRGVSVEGVELLRLDEDSRVREITILLRPLPAVVTLMHAIAPGIARGNGRPVLARAAALTRGLRAVVQVMDRLVVPWVLSDRRAAPGSRPARARVRPT